MVIGYCGQSPSQHQDVSQERQRGPCPRGLRLCRKVRPIVDRSDSSVFEAAE
jgi:hypothetical protein